MIQDTAPSERIIIIRPSLKKMCSDNACRAAVFNHMLYWIAYKYKNGEDYWYATGEELHTQMDESWSINIIRREVKALITSGLIGEMHNPKWAADRTKHFFFGKDQAKAFFTACTTNNTCPWCIGFPTVILHLLSTHLTDLLNANDSSVKCICQKHHMQLLNLLNGTNRSGTAITKVSTKVSTKNIPHVEIIEESEDSLVASASAESNEGAAFLSSLSQFEETLQEGRIGQAPLQMSCIPDRHEEEPVKPAGDSEKPAPSAVHDTTPLQETPTQDTLLPVVQIQTTKPASPNKTHRKENHKISVLSVPKVPPRVIREAIDAIRGYALDQEGPIKHQGVILKGWCQKHTLEDFQHVIEHLTKGRCSNEKHQWWREKSHMKSFFNAAKLAELTPDVLSELGYIPKPEAPPEVVTSVEEPKIEGWTPVRQIYPRNGETVTYG